MQAATENHADMCASGLTPFRIYCLLLQYECSSRNVEILESTTDAKGRKLEVIKVPCPPPMFRTHHEADTVDVSLSAVLIGLGQD
jgi:agmatine/peptidylarginine deiminase